jgi:hypothetical protein
MVDGCYGTYMVDGCYGTHEAYLGTWFMDMAHACYMDDMAHMS